MYFHEKRIEASGKIEKARFVVAVTPSELIKEVIVIGVNKGFGKEN